MNDFEKLCHGSTAETLLRVQSRNLRSVVARTDRNSRQDGIGKSAKEAKAGLDGLNSFEAHEDKDGENESVEGVYCRAPRGKGAQGL